MSRLVDGGDRGDDGDDDVVVAAAAAGGTGKVKLVDLRHRRRRLTRYPPTRQRWPTRCLSPLRWSSS